MTKAEFLKLNKSYNISPNLVHFENSVAEGYHVLENYHRREVFYRERGVDYDCVGFPSESDALLHLADKLIHNLGIINDRVA